MKKIMRVLALVLVLTMSISLFAGCGGNEDPKPTEGKEQAGDPGTAGQQEDKYPRYKLAVPIPITGNLRQYGEVYKNSIQMAVDEFNAEGGLGGKDVVVEFYDDKSDQKEAVNLASKIVEDDTVFATLGSFGSALTMAAAPTYQEASMPLMSPNCSHKDFPKMGDMMVSYSEPTTINVVAQAEKIYNDYGAPDVCFIYQGTELGVTACEVFHDTYEKLGGKILMEEMFVPGETKDFTPILSKFKDANPGAVVINCDYQDHATIMIQANEIGLDCLFSAQGQCVKSEFLDLCGVDENGVSNAEDLLVCTSGVCLEDHLLETLYKDDEVITGFVERYRAAYPGAPVDNFAAFAYDGANILLYAAREAGTTDPHKLMDAIHTVPCQLVSSKEVSYLDDGSCFKTMEYMTIKNGEWAMIGD